MDELPGSMYEYRPERTQDTLEENEEVDCEECGFHFTHDGFPECPLCGNINEKKD